MKKLILLLVVMVNSMHSHSQLNQLLHYGEKGTNAIIKKRKAKKSQELATQYTTYITAENGEPVSIMRVPNTSVKSDAYNEIIYIQERLEAAQQLQSNNQSIAVFTDNIYTFRNKIQSIKYADEYWITAHYESEAEFYVNYEKEYQEAIRQAEKLEIIRQNQIRDSLRNVRNIELKKEEEKVRLQMARQRQAADSLRNVRAIALEKEKQKTKAAQQQEQEVKIPTSSSSPTPATKTKKRSPQRPRSNIQYYVGPRGGCYYYNSKGKKQYVDRSLCN